ncbi:nik-related protein kinase [Xenopus laevis]|uniref:Nik-related protein kinase n=1 Tax=Xenopus laevis TaxID=8355 RepID=A0A8J1MG52_XENLA|nr:nik-related protein kinase [Xenopus laevis]
MPSSYQPNTHGLSVMIAASVCEIPEDSGSNTCEPETTNTSEEQMETLEQQGWHRKQQKDVAITIVRDSEKQKEILKKIDFLERTSGHGKIIGFHGAYYHPASKKMPHFEGLWASTELYTGASLEDLTNIQKQKSLPESSENDICKEVLQGLSHLDENKVIDHHLSPDNIMVDSSRDIKFRDFSSATIGLRSPTTFREAIPYRAPELKANVGSNTIANTTKENQHPPAKKYPKPKTFVEAREPIGEDEFGVIYNGWHHKEQKEVAITIIKDTKKQKEILKKMRIFENIPDHKNIVGFYGAFYNHASKKMPHYEGLWVSTELYTGSSLKELINGQKQKSLPENTIAYICKEVLQGLSHLDKNKVIHHDLRPGNIMVASSGDIKIIDFTSATKGPRSHATSGAIPYMAPEVMANIGSNTVDYTTKADVWSLGISALEMAEGYYPFSRFPENKRMKRIMHGPAPTLLWDTWSDKFHFFISECLQKNPARRPSAEQLLSHPFISNIQNERGVKKLIKRHLQKCKGTAHSHYNSLH